MKRPNPAAAIRDVESAPEHERGIHQLVGRIEGGGTHAVTIETGFSEVLSAIVVKENATTAVMATTIADSSAVAGTKTVAFTVANDGVYSYIITGFLFGDIDVVETSAATTVTFTPVLNK